MTYQTWVRVLPAKHLNVPYVLNCLTCYIYQKFQCAMSVIPAKRFCVLCLPYRPSILVYSTYPTFLNLGMLYVIKIRTSPNCPKSACQKCGRALHA